MSKERKSGFIARTAIIAAVAVGAASTTWGIAQAAENHNRANTPTKADVSPQSVPKTLSGMPSTAQVMFFVVNADGSKETAFPTNPAAGMASVRLGPGTYDVRFAARDITQCAATGSLGSPTSFGVAPGTITLVLRAGSSGKGFFIETRDSAFALSDREFMIQVTC